MFSSIFFRLSSKKVSKELSALLRFGLRCTRCPREDVTLAEAQAAAAKITKAGVLTSCLNELSRAIISKHREL